MPNCSLAELHQTWVHLISLWLLHKVLASRSVSHLHSVTYCAPERTCQIHLTGLNVSTSENGRFHQETNLSIQNYINRQIMYHAINGYLLNLAQYYAVAKPSLISSARIISGSRPRDSGRSKLHTAPARQHAKKTVEAALAEQNWTEAEG